MTDTLLRRPCQPKPVLRWFPLDPLLDFMDVDPIDLADNQSSPITALSTRMSVRLECDVRAMGNRIRRWADTGLTLYEADAIACKDLGLHPCRVWTTWFDEEALDG